jgi:hypothetical protein
VNTIWRVNFVSEKKPCKAAPEGEEGGPAPLAPASGPGRLVSVYKYLSGSWPVSDGWPALLVAQPGGAYMNLKKAEPGAESGAEEPGEGGATAMSVEYEPLGVNRRRNRNVSAEILGGFKSRPAGPGGLHCTGLGCIALGWAALTCAGLYCPALGCTAWVINGSGLVCLQPPVVWSSD